MKCREMVYILAPRWGHPELYTFRRNALLLCRGQIDHHAAQQRQGCKNGNQHEKTRAGAGKRGGPEGVKVKGKRLGQLRQPVEAVPGLRYKQGRRGKDTDAQGKDLGAENGPADALDGGIAAAQLSPPPERPRRGEFGRAGGLGWPI